MSSDGKSLYAVSFAGDNSIVRFDVNPTTGVLTPQGCFQDNDNGGDSCTAIDGLSGSHGVAVSPDGKSVYVSALDDHAITRFDRNTSTGALTPAGCVDDNDSGPDACTQSMDGLGTVAHVAVSPDGRTVYGSAASDMAMAFLARDPSTGAITPQGCIDDNDYRPRYLRLVGRRAQQLHQRGGEPGREVRVRRRV